MRSIFTACFVTFVTLSAGVARGDVVLSPDNALIDFYWSGSGASSTLIDVDGPVISGLSPVPGFTGVSVSGVRATWEVLESFGAPDEISASVTMNIFGSASGSVTTDAVRVDWSDVLGSAPTRFYGYNVLMTLWYSDGSIDEGQGGDANGNPDGAFWLRTFVGQNPGLTAVAYSLRVDWHFVGPVNAGDLLVTEVGGNSIDAGTASIVDGTVPEPGLLALCALGLAAAVGTRRARRPTAAGRS